MNTIQNITPGEILLEEFIKPLHISMAELARNIDVPANRITSIVKGSRSITADTALRLSRYFGNTHQFWLNLQNNFDIKEAESKNSFSINRIVAMA